ncbi:Hym1p, partial [Friedmanniomyces endolithicus]
MAFLFGRNRQRSAQDIVRSTKDLLQKLAKEETPLPKTEEDLSRTLTLMKVTLQGTPELEATPDAVYQLVNSVLAESLLPLLVDNIHRLPFEARKDTQTIISN